MEEEDFWKWHKNLLNKLTEGFNKYTERFYLFEAGSKNDIEREGYKRDRLCLKLFSSRLDITSCYLELIEKGNYYSAYIILCTLIENIIIGCYIFSNKSALDDFTLFATIEDLKKIKSQDESIRTEILRILKMDYYQASLNRLKKDKNKVFSSDADYMNRENYKKDWKPTVKVMRVIEKIFIMYILNYAIISTITLSCWLSHLEVKLLVLMEKYSQIV